MTDSQLSADKRFERLTQLSNIHFVDLVQQPDPSVKRKQGRPSIDPESDQLSPQVLNMLKQNFMHTALDLSLRLESDPTIMPYFGPIGIRNLRNTLARVLGSDDNLVQILDELIGNQES